MMRIGYELIFMSFYEKNTLGSGTEAKPRATGLIGLTGKIETFECARLIFGMVGMLTKCKWI